jgi:hypothetical protein
LVFFMILILSNRRMSRITSPAPAEHMLPVESADQSS